MRRWRKGLLLLLAAMLMVSFAGCGEKQAAPTVSGVEFDLSAMETEYTVGQELDLSGASYTVSYSDGTETTKAISKDMVSGFSSETAGRKTVTVSYEQYRSKFSVLVTEGQRRINIYATCGTLPTLFAGLNLVADSTESYLYYVREGTFDNSIMPGHMKMVVPDTGTLIEGLNQIRYKILQLSHENPDTYFTLYCDDMRIQWEIQLLLQNDIPENCYDVIMLSDGVGSYGTMFQPFEADNTYDAWKAYAEKYEEKRQLAIEGKDPELAWTTAPVDLQYSVIRAAQNSNVQYWMQFPELLTSRDARVNQEIEKANFIKKEPNVMFANLSQEQKELFMRMVKLDKEQFDGYFQASPKPDLVISGTSIASSGDFKAYIRAVIDRFGATYDLFFKPHPSFPPVSGGAVDKDILDENGIVIFPATMPMEALLWAYPQMKIGGYKSSLYMSAASEQVLFFLNMSSGTELPPPLDKLADMGYFNKAVYIKL